MSLRQPENEAAVRAELERAVARHQQGYVGEALAIYNRVLAAEPDNPQVLNLAGVALTQQGDSQGAISHFQKALTHAPRYPDAQRNLGIALRAAGRLDEAMSAHQQLVELQPVSAQAHNDLGITLRRAGKLARAASAYRRALELDRGYIEAMVNLGNVLQDQDNNVQACEVYRQAIVLNPSLAPAHRNLGNALQRLGDHGEAIESYRQAITIAPDYALAQADLGGALVEVGEIDDGVKCIRRALELRPDAANIHSNLGIALHHLGDFDSALAAYEESLRLEPGNSHALAYKSIALLELGRQSELNELVDHDRLLYAAEVATPQGYDSLSDFNRDLCEFAAQHPTLMGKDDRRPGITGELLTEPEGPMVALEQVIRLQVLAFIRSLPVDSAHPFVKRRTERFHMIGWANVLDGGADTHIHPHAWISGVYYSRALKPDQAGGGEHAGWIEFGFPDPALPITREPEVRLVQPRDGLMLLFPSFFWHRILPFESEEKRISYAFDILPIR